ncbi:hypothetical protein SAMN05216299_12041 [Nitrosospira sp. Nsp14]|uniref:hypothetical protein n=1 Tax=Nitrosospira sp. Nsp14 TaxID=1855333 RepID=UPI0008ECC17C|nr:hypothetical protein [Nitrosospira sp. Nsp14]SFH54262.1 hypothetical protein SAMN05216299_12041 [Nitrosospira sp. Nsp14]
MRSLILVVASFAFTTAFTAHAGVIGPEGWSPAGCGARPQTPSIDSSSADAFNKSVGAINEWQKQLLAYHDCMVKEANADSAAINHAATGEQKRINDAIEKVNQDATAGRQKVERSSSSPSPTLAPPAGTMPGNPGY